MTAALPWESARAAAHAAGARQPAQVVELPLDAADGATLAAPLTTRTDLPAFPTSSVDGWATRGPGPWRVVGLVLAGTTAASLTDDGTCVEIATGGMVPDGTEQIVRVEESTRPGDGRVRDSLGPSLPAWLRRLGSTATEVIGPVEDTLDAHVQAIKTALADGADLICTTGGTMHGPVDHLHPALHELGAEYVVNTVEVRPGFPMLLASVPGRALIAGLPGNPQSAVVALLSLGAPALAGLAGRPLPALGRIRLAGEIPGRGRYTHLALVDRDGRAVSHVGSSMLRGLAGAVGFAVIPPGSAGAAGDEAALVPLPLSSGERP